MKRRTQRSRLLKSAVSALFVSGCLSPHFAHAQSPYRSHSAEMVHFESAGASRVAEKVRSGAQGVMVEIHVKVGDTVRKGQLLGHTDLDATKLQLDLAERAKDSKANVESALGQSEAWTVAREETEEAVRRRKAEETRLEWAIAMEKMYKANYEAQLEVEKVQEIQYEHWKQQYEKRFFRAPVEGVVTEVLVNVGSGVNIATHVFTISNDNTYIVPVLVPAPLADSAIREGTLPVRSADGKSVIRALVDNVKDDPRSTGEKIINLLINAADFPAATRAKLKGMKFDVLLPQIAQELR